MIAYCARLTRAAGRFVPQSSAQRHCRHRSIRRVGSVVIGLWLLRTWSQLDPHAACCVSLGLQAWYFRSCIAKRRPDRHAIRQRSAWHLSLGGIAGLGIDLPARLFAVLRWGFWPEPALCGLNSRQINHLQRIASETHYRGSFRQTQTTRSAQNRAAGCLQPQTPAPGPAFSHSCRVSCCRRSKSA